MANFEVFSLGQAMQAGQQAAANTINAQGVAADRAKSTKAAQLRQRINEGDSDALGELMAVDPKDAKSVMDFLNTADDRDRDAMKAQNEAMAKAVLWVMDAPTEGERATRWDQSVDHLVNNQGFKEAAQYKGKYDQGTAQNVLMQAMTMTQLLEKGKGSFGSPQKGLDKDGNPVFFVADKDATTRVLKDVQPTDKDIYGKDGKGGAGGKPPKGEISNVIAKRVAERNNVPFTQNADGTISYKFPTSNAAKEAATIKARATRIYIDSGKISHDEAVEQAFKESEGKTTKPPKDRIKSIQEHLKTVRSTGG